MFYLRGHEGEIGDAALCFSPDGRLLVSGGEDATVKVWDLASRMPRATLSGHTNFVTSAAFALGGQLLVTGSWDCTVRLWDATRWERRKTYRPNVSIVCVTASPDGKTIAAAGGSPFRLPARVWRWNALTLRKLSPVGEHDRMIGSVVYSPDGRLLVSGAADKSARVWDLATGKRIALFKHRGWVQSMAISPDSRTLAVAAGRMVKLWGLDRADESSSPLVTLAGAKGTVLAVEFSPDGRRLVAGGKDGRVRFWDPATGRLLSSYRWKIGEVHALAFAPDGMTIAAGGVKGDIVVWDVE